MASEPSEIDFPAQFTFKMDIGSFPIPVPPCQVHLNYSRQKFDSNNALEATAPPSDMPFLLRNLKVHDSFSWACRILIT